MYLSNSNSNLSLYLNKTLTWTYVRVLASIPSPLCQHLCRAPPFREREYSGPLTLKCQCYLLYSLLFLHFKMVPYICPTFSVCNFSSIHNSQTFQTILQIFSKTDGKLKITDQCFQSFSKKWKHPDNLEFFLFFS